MLRGLLAAHVLFHGGRALAEDLAVSTSASRRTRRILAALDRTSSVRAVKRLQHTLAQYIHHGLWDEAGELFAADGVLQRHCAVRGPRQIAAALRQDLGRGEDGLARGTVHSQFLASPVIILSPTGETAQGRWHDVVMTGGRDCPDAWAGGIWLVDYRREDAVWRIASMRYHPTFAGPYAEGFRNVVPDLPDVAYLYTPTMAGTPQTAAEGLDAAAGSANGLTVETGRRIACLNAEDAARNLQNIFGYYLDRKMWADVADLFGTSGALTIDGHARASGREGILNLLQAEFGTAGLAVGEMNDHPQCNMLVEVAGNARSAIVRGQELGMRGGRDGSAAWSVSTFHNLFAFDGEGWTVADMCIHRELKADYAAGWGKSDLLLASEAGGRIIAPFPKHPATGRPVSLPPGLLAAPAYTPTLAALAARDPVDLADAETNLARSAGYDAIENISGTIGDYLNDSRWYELSRLFARDGERVSPGAGWYKGRDRIYEMQMTRNGVPRRPRDFIPVHLRLQPVIHVAADAASARMRTRLLQFNSAWEREGSLSAGYYEDAMIVEDDVWRFASNEIRHTWLTRSLSEGWAGVPDHLGRDNARSPDALIAAMPPDRPIEGLTYPPFPQVDTMLFHYRNPVSGREPPGYIGT